MFECFISGNAVTQIPSESQNSIDARFNYIWIDSKSKEHTSSKFHPTSRSSGMTPQIRSWWPHPHFSTRVTKPIAKRECATLHEAGKRIFDLNEMDPFLLSHETGVAGHDTNELRMKGLKNEQKTQPLKRTVKTWSRAGLLSSSASYGSLCLRAVRFTRISHFFHVQFHLFPVECLPFTTSRVFRGVFESPRIISVDLSGKFRINFRSHQFVRLCNLLAEFGSRQSS